MQYMVELYEKVDGEERAFDSHPIDAENDAGAKQQAEEWAASAVGVLTGVVYRRLVQEGRGVYHQTRGEL